MKSFKPLALFAGFVCLLAIPPLALNYTGNADLLVPGFWTMFVFVTLITFIIIVAALAVQRKNSELYAQVFLAGTTFKLLACLIFVLVFIKKMHPEKVIFVVDFMYLYFLNTVFEVYGLLRNLRNQNLR